MMKQISVSILTYIEGAFTQTLITITVTLKLKYAINTNLTTLDVTYKLTVQNW